MKQGFNFSINFALPPKCVSFAEPLVTSVRERPRTLECDKVILFYSSIDMKRFRREYREYRNYNMEYKTTTNVHNTMKIPTTVSPVCNEEHGDYNIMNIHNSTNILQAVCNEDDGYILSELLCSAVSYASGQVATLQQTIATNLMEVLNSAAETDDPTINVTNNSDLFYLVDIL